MEMKQEMWMKEMEACQLCPRNCRVNRSAGQTGFCGQSAVIKAARAALHMWEEPCISGEKGSGTVFFSGCPLQCVFCQNHEIAVSRSGAEISVGRLAEIFLELQEKHAANINLVTPGHFVPQMIEAVTKARNQGLSLPIVYNTGSYEKEETIRRLEGIVDIYLPDFKYWDEKIGERYAGAADYRKYACDAIREMVRQTGPCRFDEEGYLKQGVLVRHLVLPGNTADSKKIIHYLYETYGNSIYISIMNQYTPVIAKEAFPELARRLTEEEYDEVVDDAIALGVENGFIQEGETAEESFIPPFDYEGILSN